MFWSYSFNLFISDLGGYLSCPEVDAPKIADRHFPLLLYADDAVLLSRIPSGLKGAMEILVHCCQANHIELSYQNPKILPCHCTCLSILWQMRVVYKATLGISEQRVGLVCCHFLGPGLQLPQEKWLLRTAKQAEAFPCEACSV